MGRGAPASGLWGFACSLPRWTRGANGFTASRRRQLYDVILDMSGAGLAALITGAVWTPGSKPAVISGTAGGQTIGLE